MRRSPPASRTVPAFALLRRRIVPYRVVVSQPTVSGEMQQAGIPAVVVVFTVPGAAQGRAGWVSGAREG
ncbi:hypothetical protein VE02_06046 [Pseudogymnoascus sp. 03VT05]|nr:hypothetical protein VE02_06046 [Pseudogymnoascus sp. 03VT05]